jgi:hypothetical protein
LVLTLLGVSSVGAQERIYRCGNEYTNKPTDYQVKTCKLVDGGTVSVVPGVARPSTANAGGAASGRTPVGAAGTKVDSSDQRARDADARSVLEAELKRAQARRAELLADYKDGQPDMQGPETRNHQKYLDRVAELKASIARVESDITGITRELARLGGGGASAASTAK